MGGKDGGVGEGDAGGEGAAGRPLRERAAQERGIRAHPTGHRTRRTKTA